MKAYIHIIVSFLYYTSSTKDIPVFRIVGGQIANQKDWTFLGAMTYKGFHHCGVTLLEPNCALTAAHCLVKVPDRNTGKSDEILDVRDIVVVFGISDMNKFSEGESSYVEKILIHPQYDNVQLFNDIALVKLSSNISTNDRNVGLTKVATTRIQDETVCKTAGWGSKRQKIFFYSNERSSKFLLEVDLPIASEELCRAIYGKENDIGNSTLCTLAPEGGHDSCTGDSGGPLVCEGWQIGIVSWGIGCGSPYTPAVFTNVSKFSNWLKLGCSGIESKKMYKSSDEMDKTRRFPIILMFILHLLY